MKNKLLVICGPTATGKTSLGILLAKKFNGEIISADSRQVYKYMDIGTGKEWGDVPIWGYDLVKPKEDFSVSQFAKFAKKKISEILKRKKLPILLGGTGLYIKAVVEDIPTISIPKNNKLRKGLKNLSISKLYDKLATLDSTKAASLNLSDKKNPVRLTRAIEIAQWQLTHGIIENKRKVSKYNTLYIGLKTDMNKLSKIIEKRVENRMNNGFIYEIESLLKSGVSWKNQSMKSLGYREAEGFLKKGLGYEEFTKKWALDEYKYAKRQMTWFRKNKDINWFDIEEDNYPKNVENMVKKWYSIS